MKKFVSLLALTLSLGAFASDPHWVTVDAGIWSKLSLEKTIKVEKVGMGAVLVQLNNAEISLLSALIHRDLHRCGGFINHDNREEAMAALAPNGHSQFATLGLFDDYAINQQSKIVPMVSEVQSGRIETTINMLSAFNNRYYTAPTGLQSMTAIRDLWASMSKGRSDIKVEFFTHKKWPQPSVVLTIAGSSQADEIVVLGGHGDSINQGLFGASPRARAPGSDDNASGIATLTEALQVALDHDFHPARTIHFMAYAAEEVGLLGSKEIAASFKAAGKKVVGVLQYDMTLNKGSANLDIVMMSDNTNKAQNEFIGKLIDEYVKVPWGYSQCGYGCSDHASWTNNGYPSSIPFESTMQDINHRIHTEHDTLENTREGVEHSAKFAKLAIAYMVELAN